MIISASRRTDIPAFFGEWFLNRLKAQEVLVRNPMNSNQITRISLNHENIEAIVFWTKDPTNFLKYIETIQGMGFKFYFQFTLTTYDNLIELNVKSKSGIIDTFIELSKLVGKNRVIWRYDPIFINDKYSIEYHQKWFEYLCERISPYTRKCVISFVDEYSFLKNKFKENDIKEMDEVKMRDIAEKLYSIALKFNLILSTCSEKIDLSNIGISHNKCIDELVINEISNNNLTYKKDPIQREECGCMTSRDIGAYSTCGHNCLYCYASRKGNSSLFGLYDPNSPLLCDSLNGTEKIVDFIEKKSLKKKENELFEEI
ncbi:DUF1848 domain-containing protein [Alkalispirochaeta alkalica]|uniref:DUF1848 domain-containing protein n=1 Tax=Alkalispirochaeta alkalica TaxID=46356 RepID=UPI0003A34679|nr:DUF1848 domain-containing protein [Alkalispirochaeta alkalica]